MKLLLDKLCSSFCLPLAPVSPRGHTYLPFFYQSLR
jgi:hypothetical protein